MKEVKLMDIKELYWDTLKKQNHSVHTRRNVKARKENEDSLTLMKSPSTKRRDSFLMMTLIKWLWLH